MREPQVTSYWIFFSAYYVTALRFKKKKYSGRAIGPDEDLKALLKPN